MAGSAHQLDAGAYPSIMLLAQRIRRRLLLHHCLKAGEKSLWWCASVFAAGATIHHAVTALDLLTVTGIALTPLVLAIAFALFSAKVSLASAATRCDRWLDSKHLYTTAVEYLTTESDKPHRLATDYVLAQAETLSRQWLPQSRHIQHWKPSPWLAAPLGISIAAVFFQTLPGKQAASFSSYPLAAQTSHQAAPPSTAADDLSARLKLAFKQIDRQQLSAADETQPNQAQLARPAASRQDAEQTGAGEAWQHTKQVTDGSSSNATAPAPSAQNSRGAGGNSTQQGRGAAEAVDDKRAPAVTPALELEFSYYELESNNTAEQGFTASGKQRELTTTKLKPSPARPDSSTATLSGNTRLYDLQTSPQQRRYLDHYFNQLKAEQ